MKPIRYVYVAGPLSAPTPDGVMSHVRRAMTVGAQLINAGLRPFIPHLCVWLDQKHPRAYEDWLKYDLDWIERCDALLRIAPSPGTDREVTHALSKGIPVYTDVDTLLQEAAG